MLVRILLAVYLAALAVVGFFPTPVDRGFRRQLQVVTDWCASHGLGFVTYSNIEFTANIGLFVPLGFLLALIFGIRFWWLAPVLCFAATVFIEFVQGVALAARYASVGDVIANTSGGLVGTLLALVILLVQRHRRVGRAAVANADAHERDATP
jgi:hypothetical protein